MHGNVIASVVRTTATASISNARPRAQPGTGCSPSNALAAAKRPLLAPCQRLWPAAAAHSVSCALRDACCSPPGDARAPARCREDCMMTRLFPAAAPRCSQHPSPIAHPCNNRPHIDDRDMSPQARSKKDLRGKRVGVNRVGPNISWHTFEQHLRTFPGSRGRRVVQGQRAGLRHVNDLVVAPLSSSRASAPSAAAIACSARDLV
jgi:hypothetical protein